MLGSNRENGQATVELAFALILLSVVFMLLVQVGVVAQNQILLTHAAREGARAAAVDPSPGVAAAAAARSSGLNQNRLRVESSTDDPAGFVNVKTTYSARISMLGRTILEPELRSSASMKTESGGL